MRSPTARLALALMLGGLPPIGRCQYISPPAVAARLASGRAVEITLHRPVNALADAARSGDAIIAATADGRLLRFEGPELRLAKERDAGAAIACLGKGEGDAVLAGFEDGRVGRVDPDTLDLAEIARLPEEPQWVGWSPRAGDGRGGIVAVARGVVHDLGAKRAIDTKNAATACLVDHDGWLWVGGDRGEWGGRVARVDLRAGTFVEVPPPPRPAGDDDPAPSFVVADSSPPPAAPPHEARSFWSGVYGFVELSDGQVWAYGGTMHMGISDAFIGRVDDLVGRSLFTYKTPNFDDLGTLVPFGPVLPVTQILEDGDALLVLAYSDVFRVDRRLTNWEKTADLRLRYTWGRRDAVGAYPAVRAVLPPSRPAGPVLLATASDGLIELDGSRVKTHLVSGRLGASNIRRIEMTAEGLLFLEGDESPAWKLAPEGWRAVDLAPPFEVDPDSDAPQFERDLKGWESTRVLVTPGGEITTVSDVGLQPGTVVVARREGARAMVLGRETSDVMASNCFSTPDGLLWNAYGLWLRRFSDGRWRRVTELQQDWPNAPVAIRTKGPPWVVHDAEESGPALRLLDPGRGDAAPSFTRIILREGDAELTVHGATAWSDDAVLLSTNAGLRAYMPSASAHAKVDLPDPENLTGVLARDGLGRLWLGGDDGLRLAVPGAKAVESFADVPPIGRVAVTALAPDPDHPDGVVAGLGPRGVAFVRATLAP